MTFWVVTGVPKESQQKELINQCMDRRCVYGFALHGDTVIILCRQHGGYDFEALAASIGHFLGEFLDADAVMKTHYPKGGNG